MTGRIGFPGIGTVVNVIAIIAGGLIGGVFGRFLKEKQQEALANISMVGSVMIFCVGINLVWGKTVRVANMLPGLVIAAALAFTPWAL